MKEGYKKLVVDGARHKQISIKQGGFDIGRRRVDFITHR